MVADPGGVDPGAGSNLQEKLIHLRPSGKTESELRKTFEYIDPVFPIICLWIRS